MLCRQWPHVIHLRWFSGIKFRWIEVLLFMKKLWAVVISILLLGVSVTATDAAPALQTQIEVTSPRPNAVLRGSVSVQGTANHPDFWKYEVHFAPGMNPPDNAWSVLLVREESVVNGQLAVWDTNTVPDGTYSLRLRVVRNDGNWEDLIIRPVSVQNQEPVPTETPEGTPTPLATLTPLSTEPPATQPPTTPEVDQPTVVLPPTMTPTQGPAQADGGDSDSDSGEAAAIVPTEPPVIPEVPGAVNITGGFNMDAIVSACMFGAGLTLALFAFVGLLFITRRLVRRWL